MKKCVIVGGSNGLGLSIAIKLRSFYDKLTIVDIVKPNGYEFDYVYHDLSKDSPAFLFDLITSCDCLIITAGFGRVDYFECFSLVEIKKTIDVNYSSIISIISIYYPILLHEKNKFCMVVGSIAGEICSPLLSLYGSAKAGVNKFCESLNIELEKSNSTNCITCVMPLSFKGSSFSGGKTDLNLLSKLSDECINKMNCHCTSFYPDSQICLDVIKRYTSNKHEFGISSFDYKIDNNRIQRRKMIKVGYLSGTFDLFHIGHLNIIKNAKRYCDYLVVGVHPDGSHKGKETFIPLNERMEIIKSLKYVDEVIVCPNEDSDAYNIVHYDYLFVGSDYKGTERFNRYEKELKPLGVNIIYFDYTKTTSSTQLRKAISRD